MFPCIGELTWWLWLWRRLWQVCFPAPSKATVVAEVLPGAKWCPVSSVNDAQELISRANANRKVSKTLMNAESSRSHSVLTLRLTQKMPAEATLVKQSRLVLVDLAGSECAKKSGAVGHVLREARNINRSLLATRQLIRKLAANGGAPRQQYRQSVLTMILHMSLGRNCITRLIACLSPCE